MKNDFFVGFECECIIDDRDASLSAMNRLLAEIHPDIELSDDGSIQVDDAPIRDDDDYSYDHLYSAEIVTPPLKLQESLTVLGRVFKLIHKVGYTGESCGLHVNISPVDKKKFDMMNNLYIAYHPVFREIAEAFDRDSNDFCIPNELPSNLWHDIVTSGNGCDDIQIMQDKEAAINFCHLDSSIDYKHYEVRAFGNENYHRRLVEVRKYIYKVLDVMRNSMKYNFDYMKK